MTRPAITRVSNMEISPTKKNLNSTYTGLYPPSFTAVELATIPESKVKDGALAYDSTNNAIRFRRGGVWATLATE